MAGFDRGVNSGITGMISLSGSDPFTGKCYGFAQAMEGSVQDFPGRGDDIWGDPRLVGLGGTLLVRFMVQPGLGFPLPTVFTGQTGSIVLQLHKKEDGTVIKETVAVQVTSHKMRRDDGEPKGEPTAPATDNWHGTLTCRITDMPTMSGFTGAQRSGTTPTYDDKHLYAGISKTLDIGKLQDGATRSILVWPVADSDQAEMISLTAYVLDATGDDDPTVQGLKVRPSGATRVNFAAIVVKLVWARTTTDEDVLNEATTNVLDSQHLASQATVAAFNATPSAPSGDSFVKRTASTKEYNDAMVLHTEEHGLRDTKDDQEMPNSLYSVDANDLDTKQTIAEVYPTANEPDDPTVNNQLIQNVNQQYQELNRLNSLRITTLEANNSIQKRTFPKISTTQDANDIADEAVRAEIWPNPSLSAHLTPADAPANNVKLIDYADVPITPDYSMRVWAYGPKNSKDELILPNYETTTDASGLDSKAIRAYLDGDSVPSTPSGMKLRDTKVRPVTLSLGTNRTLTVLIYGTMTRAEEIERDGTFVKADPNSLDSVAQQTFVATSQKSSSDVTLSLPTDVELDDTEYKQLNDTYIKTTVSYKTNNAKNVWERLKAKKTTDVGNTAQGNVVVKVLSTATPSADDTYNADTTNLEFATAEVIKISATQYAHIYTFDPLSPTNKIINDGTFTATDPVAVLIGEAEATQVTANSSETTPTISGRVCVRYIVKKIGRTRYEHHWWFDFRSNAAKLIADKTTATIDVSGLESEAFTAEVYLISGGPAGAGSAPYANLVNITARYIEIENPLYRCIVYGWALVTNQQKIEYRESSAEYDGQTGLESEVSSIVASTGTDSVMAASAYTANQATVLGVRVQHITPALALQKLKYEGGDKRLTITPSSFEQQVRGVPISSVVAADLPNITPAPGSTVLYDATAIAIVKYRLTSDGPQLRIQPMYIERRRERIVLRRIFTESTLAKLYLAIGGTVNNAPFLEWLTGEVKYIGPSAVWSYTVSGVRRFMIDFVFESDDYKWFTDALLPEGLITVRSGTAAITHTSTYLTNNLEAGFVGGFRPSNTFSGFIT